MISGGSDPRLSIGSPESDESGEEDDEEALLGLNLIGNSMLSNDKQRQQHLRALGKSSSINSNNSSNSNNLDRKRPYPCKVCPSKFGSKMELEEHQNSHTGQKPFECEVCKSRFNRRSTLWNHKRIHSDAKPFVCTICHMQFKWKNSLKCHKEMHIRKNETPSIGDIDADIRQLTYATAAKRRMLEMDGGDSTRSASSLTIFSAASTSSQSNNNNNNNGGVGSCGSSSSSGGGGNDSTTKNVQRKKQKLTKKDSSNSIKKETMEATTNSSSSLFSASATADAEAAATAAAVAANNDAHQLNLLMNKAFGTSTHGGNDFDNNHTTSNYQGLMSNQAMRKLTFGNLAGDFDNSSNNLMSRDFATDFSLDQSNFDLMNNPLWMHLWNNEQVETMNNFSNPQNNPLFGGMDDPSKVLTGGIFDLKDTLGLQSPNGNNTCNNNNATTNHINMLLPKPMLNIDLNSFNSLQDSVNQQSNLPGINHLTSGTSFPDYSSHDTSSLTSQFHLGQNQSTASSSSTPSSNGHQPNGHLNSELSYHQPLDHALLLNTNHSNDYMLPLEYMTPTGGGGNQQQRQQHSTSLYSSHDLPLSALTSSSSHDPLEHSPHSSSTSRGMFYHSAASNLNDHHPGCISSSQLSTHAAAIAAAQQMR
uniref:C2H2-type domain-containing protein n=1 Tax=Panagrolaimus sp. ES5 TaxID=591445 RepID=A0AC34GPY7_9BILA